MSSRLNRQTAHTGARCQSLLTFLCHCFCARTSSEVLSKRAEIRIGSSTVRRKKTRNLSNNTDCVVATVINLGLIWVICKSRELLCTMFVSANPGQMHVDCADAISASGSVVSSWPLDQKDVKVRKTSGRCERNSGDGVMTGEELFSMTGEELCSLCHNKYSLVQLTS